MAMTFYGYLGYAYGIPFAMFAFLFVIITIVNRRANAFIIEHVLGIELKNSNDDKKNEKSPKTSPPKPWSLDDDVDKFLHIKQHTETDEPKALPWIVRLFCDFFSSAILAVLLEIIFEKCILANQALVVGHPCPELDVDCFGAYNGSRYFGPFQCEPGQTASFPVTSEEVTCFGWRYQDMTTDDVLEAIGVSGGLLGLVACIVPFVYHISCFKKHWWYLSIPCVILPMIPMVSFALIVWWIYPEAVSVLTIITFALLIVMVSGAWIWAVVASCRSAGICKSSCCRCCFWTNCCSKNSCWCKAPKNYPFCCSCCCIRSKPSSRVESSDPNTTV